MGRKLDKARAAVDVAEQQVKRWQGKADELVAELAEAERGVGAVALETGDLEGAARGVVSLREQVATAGATVTAAEATLRAAKRDALLAEASELHAKAGRLGSAASKHAAKTAELLKELEAHEGGRYVPDQPQPGVASDTMFWTPRSQRMRNEANGLAQRARTLESQAAALAPQVLEPAAIAA